MEEINSKQSSVTILYYGHQLTLFWYDLWLIEELRKIQFGKLSEVEVQDGRVVMVKKWEKKIKPQMEETNVKEKTN
jgi:hypothetical protein